MLGLTLNLQGRPTSIELQAPLNGLVDPSSRSPQAPSLIRRGAMTNVEYEGKNRSVDAPRARHFRQPKEGHGFNSASVHF
jgi:hypothetical protein